MKNYIIKITIGIGISILITIIGLFIFSLLLTYTGISENVIEPVIIAITGVSILIGSTIVSSRLKNKGIINGMIVGGFYMMILYISSGIISRNFILEPYSLIMIGIGILTGIVGGIVGVNLK